MRLFNYNCRQAIAVGGGRRLFGYKLLLRVPCISTTIIILAVMVGCSFPSAACADRIYTSGAAAAYDKMHDVATYHEQQVEHNLCEELLCSSIKLSTEMRKTTMAEKEAELRASLNRAAEQLLLTSTTTPVEENEDKGKISSTATTAPRVLHEVPSGPNPISNSLPGT
ncbi:hypothetical protein L7F22_056822 [Adiantum nelumboides]|nr:hypothetical protein [Adiantum nelumboides]